MDTLAVEYFESLSLVALLSKVALWIEKVCDGGEDKVVDVIVSQLEDNSHWTAKVYHYVKA